MNSIFDFTNISDFVAFTLEERQNRNQNYSLGSYARDLEISKSILSGVITGKKGLRLITLNKIIKAKNLNTIEDEYLKCIWALNFSKSKLLKERAIARIKVLSDHKVHTPMDEIHFNLLQEWFILPVFELISNGHDINEICNSLWVKVDDVKNAVQLLLLNNYLSVDEEGGYCKFKDHIRFESPVSAENIKNYHKNFLELSSRKLFVVPQSKRKYLTSTLTISSEMVQEAKDELESFLSTFTAKYSNSKGVNDVYALALQFYPLTEEVIDVQ